MTLHERGSRISVIAAALSTLAHDVHCDAEAGSEQTPALHEIHAELETARAAVRRAGDRLRYAYPDRDEHDLAQRSP